MAQLAEAITLGQAIGTAGGPSYVVKRAGMPADPTAALATHLTAYDAVGAAIIAISGDSYSAVTHQFTNGGATGLTSAQLHTQLTALNAAIASFLSAQAALKAGDAILLLDSTKFTSKNQVWFAVRKLLENAVSQFSL